MVPPHVTACPQAEVLEQLLLGRLALAEAEELEHHVLDCPRCAATLSRLPAVDPLVEAVRATRDTEFSSNLDLAKALIPWLKRLRPKEPLPSLTPAPLENITLPLASRTSEDATLPPAAAPHDTDPDAEPSATQVTFDFLAPAQEPGEMGRLGPYRVLKPLGAGGMGMVFLAHDPRLQRHIALKVIKAELVERADVRERFLQEAQAIAALEHDNIVAIFQVDEDRGVPFLAMPLLRGESLEDRLQNPDRPLRLAETLRIARELATGLAAAHDRGLVHRDIKPGNIWLESVVRRPSSVAGEAEVGTATDDGRRATDTRVKILDFGLAQAVQGREAEKGRIVGTPSYMAPEQAQGQLTDARADLFSLGCVLYRMTTGTAPFQGADVISTLFNVATVNPAAPRELNPEVPPALAELTLKLLAKKPDERPASAHAVVEALRAIEASLQPRPSWWRWGVLTAAAVLAAIGLTLWLLPPGQETLPPPEPVPVTFTYDEPDRRLTLQRGEEMQELDLKKGVTQPLMPGDYQVRPAAAPKGRKLVPDHLTVKAGEPVAVAFRLVGEIRQDRWHSQTVWGVALSPRKGDLLALSVSNDGTTRIWQADRDDGSRQLGDEDAGPVHGVAISADGKWALTAAAGRRRPGSRKLPEFPIRLWDLDNLSDPANLTPRATFLGHERKVSAIAFAPDGKRFLVAGDDGLCMWDIAGHAKIFTTAAHGGLGINGVAFSPDGRQALTGGGDNLVMLWDAATGRPLQSLKGHTGKVRAVAFAPSGKEAASAGDDGVLRLWDLQTLKSRELRGHTQGVNSVVYSPDGRRLLSGGDDGTVRLWDGPSGQELYRFLGHTGAVRGVAVSAEGRRAVSGGADRTVRLWELPR